MLANNGYTYTVIISPIISHNNFAVAHIASSSGTSSSNVILLRTIFEASACSPPNRNAVVTNVTANLPGRLLTQQRPDYIGAAFPERTASVGLEGCVQEALSYVRPSTVYRRAAKSACKKLVSQLSALSMIFSLVIKDLLTGWFRLHLLSLCIRANSASYRHCLFIDPELK